VGNICILNERTLNLNVSFELISRGDNFITDASARIALQVNADNHFFSYY
jgi:hypothetical protein